MGMGHLWLKWVGHLWLKWVGHLWLKWAGHLDLNGWDIYSLDGWGSYGKVSYCFLGDMLKKKNTGLQGSTLSSHRMTMGFSPFELATHGLLQKGRDHSLPKFCFVRSPAFWLAQLLFKYTNTSTQVHYGGSSCKTSWNTYYQMGSVFVTAKI